MSNQDRPGQTLTDHDFRPHWATDDLTCGTNWRDFESGEWRVCHKPIWSGVHRRPLPSPEIGREQLCLLCAYVKPWGTFDTNTGAVVCSDCRTAAFLASQKT